MNGIIIVNKPMDWTSHDVVGKLRGILKERRIGHGGTLDPMAVGVLPVFVGRATRAVEFCESSDKDYTAGIRFGIVTDTQDTTGTTIATKESFVYEDDLRNILSDFIGKQEQIPPMYSAVKVNGKKLYELARKGIETERKPRKIEISKLNIAGQNDNGDWLLNVTCSKGTYIRTLCNDIGERLGCGAVMSSLLRTRAGVFRLEDAVTIEQVQQVMQSGEVDKILRPIDSVFKEYPSVTVCGKNEKQCRNGTTVNFKTEFNGYCRVYAENGEFLMLGRAESGVLKTVKSFFEV